jgi:Carboxypeptidase regulatory-like domain
VANRSIQSWACTFAVVLIATFFMIAPVMAQTGAASITGTITDSTGGAVANATITARDTETGTTRTVQASSSGEFSISPLQVGAYELSGGAPGFKQELRRGIVLVVGQEAVINLTLQVGNITEQVTVTDAPPLVNTTLNSTDGLISEQQIKNLPLNGRSFDQLLALNAGTVNNGSNASANLWSSFSVSGQRPESNRYLMNGIDYIGSNASGAFIAPEGASGQLLGVEAVREFNVLLDTYGAQYGKRVGAQISIVSSSGSNKFHGDVFEYIRNNDLDARNYFDATKAAPPFERNQFGGFVGGPIIRNRAFFFVNYEGFRQRLATSSVAVVPDTQARLGLMPCYLVAPAGGCSNPSAYVTPTALKSGMLPYANDFWPTANGAELLSSGLPTGTAYAIANPISRIQEDYGLARLDYTLSSKDSFSANYIADYGNGTAPNADPTFIRDTVQNMALGDLQEMHLFSNSLINTVTLGYSRAFSSQVLTPVPGVPTSLDFLSGVTTGGAISIPGISAPAGNKLNYNTRNYYTEADDVRFNKGRQFMSFGAWFQQMQIDPHGANTATGGSVIYPTLLAFLQDQPTQFSANANPSSDYYRTNQMAFYFEDEIKLTPRLTLRAGLREESTNGWNEAYGHASNYAYDNNGIPLTNPIIGYSGLQSNNAKDLWQPRLGLAWDPTGSGKWAVRAGIGIYNDLQDNLGRQFNVDAPYNSVFVITGTPLLSIIPVTTGKAGAPSCSATSTLVPPACVIFAPGGVDPNFHTPTLQQWSLTVERQLMQNLVLRVRYVGSEAYHVLTNLDTNEAVPQICGNAAGCLSGGNLAATKDVTVPQGTLYEPATPGKLPNIDVGPGQTWFYIGTANYQGGTVSLDKRASKGLTFIVNYTYSKSLDVSSAGSSNLITNEPITIMDRYDLKLSRGPSSFNVKHVLSANYLYQLPFGKGQSFVNQGNGVVERMVGGWVWTGNLLTETGFPFTPEVGTNISGTGDTQNPDVPNLNPSFHGSVIEHLVSQWYNPAAFTLPLAGTFGNVGRSSFVGPDLTSFSTSLIKHIPITEKVNLEFRAEGFNVFNHANFAAPTTTTFSGTNYNSAAGTITATATTSRQLQFALKLEF